jgi:replicative superfamily II helicase
MVSNEGFADYFQYFTPERPEWMEALQRWYVQFPEVLRKKVYNQITLGKAMLNLTDFQSGILNYLQSGLNVVFSAPTSSGKSFLIMNYIAQKLATSTKFSAVYIVPTKALMAEVQAATASAARNVGLAAPEFVVLSSPSVLNLEEIRAIPKKVLVLTQERLQELLANRMDISVDLLILDEAQKVAEGYRGIVIEDAIRELIESNPSMQKIMISPYVRNLVKFSQIFGVPYEKVVNQSTSRSPVGQSVLFVKFAHKPEGRGVDVLVSAYLPEIDATVPLETISDKKNLPKLVYDRKAWVARFLVGEDEPTLIYCNGSSDSRKVGQRLVSFSPKENQSEEVLEAIDFLKEHVHKEYYLTELLRFGVGYHYGKMPQFIRFFVKDLFEKKKIKVLCCTSTLLEGVNLPAKNLVMYKPRAGGPLTTLATRNLVGRAGRLQKDYYGKIYCIEDDDFSQDRVPFNDELESISSSSEEILLNRPDMLIQYLKEYKVSSDDETMKGVKSFATSLIIRRILHSNSSFLSKFKEREDRISQLTLDRISDLLEKISVDVASLEPSVILRNRSIDPRFQHELYLQLKDRDSMPLPPYPVDVLFYEKLETIFKLVSVILLRQREDSDSYRHYNYLANLWINQASYKEILEGQLRYRQKNASDFDLETLREEDGHRKFVNNVIEDLDDDLEDRLKFDYTRALKCYADIVEHILKEKNKETRFCKELPLFLEAGAKDKNILLLLEIGLSRNTAIEIASRVSLFGRTLPQWKSLSEAIVWLKEHEEDLRKTLHPMLYDEVTKILT